MSHRFGGGFSENAFLRKPLRWCPVAGNPASNPSPKSSSKGILSDRKLCFEPPTAIECRTGRSAGKAGLWRRHPGAPEETRAAALPRCSLGPDVQIVNDCEADVSLEAQRVHRRLKVFIDTGRGGCYTPAQQRSAPLDWACCRTSERKGDLARTQVPFSVLWGGSRRARASGAASMTRRNPPYAGRNPRKLVVGRNGIAGPRPHERWEYRNAFHRNGQVVQR
jgi:hypothetical protein